MIGCGSSAGPAATGPNGDAGAGNEGGAASAAGGDGSSADTSVLPGTADAGVAGCPGVQPAPDSPCSTAAVCTWGDHPLTSCRSTGSCMNGRWSVQLPPAVCAMNPPECPAAQPSGTCPATIKASCLYEQRYACTCVACCNAPGCSALCGNQPQGTVLWTCTGAPVLPAPCPSLVPNQGAPCNLPPEIACPRTSCGLEVTCRNGVWHWSNNASCPGS